MQCIQFINLHTSQKNVVVSINCPSPRTLYLLSLQLSTGVPHLTGPLLREEVAQYQNLTNADDEDGHHLEEAPVQDALVQILRVLPALRLA